MERNLGFLTLLLHRSPDLDVSAVFRRGQSQQVSSLIQYTSWQAKINEICLPASPSSLPFAADRRLSPKPPAPATVWKICTPPVYKSLKPFQQEEEKKFSFPGHPRAQTLCPKSSLAETLGVVLQLHLLHLLLLCWQHSQPGRLQLSGQIASVTLESVWPALGEVNPASFTFSCNCFSNPLQKMYIYTQMYS